jgi:hypothetical protein
MPFIGSVRNTFSPASKFGIIKIDGLTAASAAPSAQFLVNSGNTTSGTYWIKPTGYSGSAFQVYCDLNGTASGIGSGGWMRIEYSTDLYTQAAPWTETANNTLADPPFSGNFTFVLSDAQINALLSSTTETRQVFESYGYGSVGWTYASAQAGDYLGALAWGGTLHRSTAAPEGNNLILGATRPTSISWSFVNIQTFTDTGTDPTDINDNVWRQSIIYLRELTTRQYLPIKGVYAADVDSVGEQRYFPLVSGVKSYTWVK